MARTWQHHGNNMSRTWQQPGKNMAITLQEHNMRSRRRRPAVWLQSILIGQVSSQEPLRARTRGCREPFRRGAMSRTIIEVPPPESMKPPDALGQHIRHWKSHRNAFVHWAVAN